MLKTERSHIFVAALFFCFTLFACAVSAEETLTTPAPACGFTPALTANAYSGLVEITVSGNIFFVPPDGHYDAFYGNNSNGPAPGYPPSPLRLALLKDGACTCSLECKGSNYFASDFLVGPYPAYNPAHVYTFMLDLPFNDRLALGIPDCGCWDNQGSWTITIKQAVDPVPDIRANNSDGPLTISKGNPLSVTVSLDPLGAVGRNADWWVAVDTPFGLYWYTVDKGWVRSDKPIRVYGGALFKLSPVEVLNTTGLPPRGIYTFYFAVDFPMNGSLNFDQLYVDSVEVQVRP